MATLLVIGNGFDLAHGRKTGYMEFMRFVAGLKNGSIKLDNKSLEEINEIFPDFKESSLITYFVNQYTDNSEKGNWIDMETELKEFVRYLIDFIDEENTSCEDEISQIHTYRKISKLKPMNIIVRNLTSLMQEELHNNLTVKKEYIDIWGKLNKDKILNQINDELERLTHLLRFYLISVEPKLRECDLLSNPLFEQIKPDMILSFNYTDTYEQIYGLEGKTISYIHGSVKKNNMVLGYDDVSESSDDIIFKKYYKRLIYETDRFEIPFNKDNYGGYIKPIVHIFGHSLDISDEDIIKNIISNSEKTYIYCKDKKDKELKILNIIKILGKNDADKKIKEGSLLFELSV